MSRKNKWPQVVFNGCAILILLAAITQTASAESEILVDPQLGLTTTENGGSASFTISLPVEPTSDVIVSVSSSNPSEGTVSTSSVTLNASNYSSGVTVTITGQDDLVVDGDVGYTIITGAAVSDDINYAGVVPADVSVTNTDNDTAEIIVAPTTGLVTTEDGGTATFNIRLTSQPTANVTIGLTSSDTT